MIDKLSGVADPGNLSVSITPNAATKTLIVRSHYAAQLAIPFVSADSLIFENAVTVPDLE
jgi:hypothetical protein